MAEKQAFSYGGKENNGGSKNRKQKIKRDSIEKAEIFEKSALGNGCSQNLENTNCTTLKTSLSWHPSNRHEYYSILDTGNSSLGTEFVTNFNSRNMDIYDQQSHIQKAILFQNPDMQAFQFDQQSQHLKQPQFSQQYPGMEEIQYPVDSKNTSLWRAFIYWRNYYFGSSTQLEVKQHEDNQKYVSKKVHTKSNTIVYEPNFIRERVTQGIELFKLLEECHTSCGYELGLISVEYNWTETHLKIERGLNILATCKNYECALHMQGIVCPRGRFVDRNGYCTLDMQLFKVKCPRCKVNITPDESFGFGFYNCSFKLTYRLVNQQEYRTHVDGNSGVFYFVKFCPFREKFLFLEAQIAILSELL